ncbi:MAG: Rieske 2Fe-2S domain-containing protein [Caldilineaceae bacterium]|nr:Rieske 2Fe-2S domain-containing protein [Caldilineaceae bacterium]
MANISDLSGDERQQRIAELKKKMQQAAQKAQAEHAEDEEAAENPQDAPVAESAGEVQAEAPVVAAAEVTAAAETETTESEAPVAVAEAQTEVVEVDEEVNAAADEAQESVPVVAPAAPKTNGAAGSNGYRSKQVASATTAPAFTPVEEMTEEQQEKRQMNRREFLTYAWGGTMGLLALQAGLVTFQFMYPRFKAGEFGGKFFMGAASSLPTTEAAPIAEATGKFWWVNIEGEGPKAIYMVCTHLGCLYKWVGENNRFECPCHGSKFTREGDYIEGPAPRSLDYFQLALENEEYVVDTGAKINGAPAADSPAAGTG